MTGEFPSDDLRGACGWIRQKLSFRLVQGKPGHVKGKPLVIRATLD